MKKRFLNAQIQNSFRFRRTSPFLKRLIFSVVDRVAESVYGDHQSMKCMQVSQGVIDLLAEFNISAKLYAGALCAAEIWDNGKSGSWGGFWGQDHHFWAVTEFGEFADCNMGRLHEHPALRRPDAIPIPPVWWSEIGSWPPVIRYLPDTVVHHIELDDDSEVKLFNEFRETLKTEFSHVIGSAEAQDIVFRPILEDMNTMNALHERGEPWLNAAIMFQDHEVPFPEWIRLREKELTAAYKEGRSAPSRLINVPGLFNVR